MTTESVPSSGEDAITMLTADHREVERLHAEFQATAAGDTHRRQELANQIIHELSVHAIVEEQYLYPLTAEAVSNGEQLADHSLDEHQGIKDRLAELDDMEAGDDGYAGKLAEVMATVGHHVQEEEGELFPRLRQSVGADSLTQAGEKMRRAKAVAPTRPHPRAPNTPPGNKVLGAFVGMADKVRDLGRDFPEDR